MLSTQSTSGATPSESRFSSFSSSKSKSFLSLGHDLDDLTDEEFICHTSTASAPFLDITTSASSSAFTHYHSAQSSLQFGTITSFGSGLATDAQSRSRTVTERSSDFFSSVASSTLVQAGSVALPQAFLLRKAGSDASLASGSLTDSAPSSTRTSIASPITPGSSQASILPASTVSIADDVSERFDFEDEATDMVYAFPNPPNNGPRTGPAVPPELLQGLGLDYPQDYKGSSSSSIEGATKRPGTGASTGSANSSPFTAQSLYNVSQSGSSGSGGSSASLITSQQLLRRALDVSPHTSGTLAFARDAVTTLEVPGCDSFDINKRLDIRLRSYTSMPTGRIASKSVEHIVAANAAATAAASELATVISFVPAAIPSRANPWPSSVAQRAESIASTSTTTRRAAPPLPSEALLWDWAVDMRLTHSGKATHQIRKRTGTKTCEVVVLGEDGSQGRCVNGKPSNGLLKQKVSFQGPDDLEWTWKGSVHSSYALKASGAKNDKTVYAVLRLTLSDNIKLDIRPECSDPLFAIASCFPMLKARRDLFDRQFTSQTALDRMSREMRPDPFESLLFHRKNRSERNDGIQKPASSAPATHLLPNTRHVSMDYSRAPITPIGAAIASPVQYSFQEPSSTFSTQPAPLPTSSVSPLLATSIANSMSSMAPHEPRLTSHLSSRSRPRSRSRPSTAEASVKPWRAGGGSFSPRPGTSEGTLSFSVPAGSPSKFVPLSPNNFAPSAPTSGVTMLRE